MSAYIFGSIAYDRIMTFPGKFSEHILPEKIHIMNVSFLINRIEERLGGTAGNIAYTLALLSERPYIVGSVGKDFDRYEKVLKKYNLPLDALTYVDDAFTAGCYIMTDQSNNQITAFNPGAMSTSYSYTFPNAQAERDIAIVSPASPTDMIALPEHFKKLGIPYIFDPGQQVIALSGDDMLQAIHGSAMLVVNDYELEVIMKTTGKTKAELIELTSYVITTLGEHGSRIDNKANTIMVPSVPAKTVSDPTGAGDAYRAGLIKGIMAGWDIEHAARLGSTCASFCVECYGTQEHMFTVEECIARHEAAFGSGDYSALFTPVAS